MANIYTKPPNISNSIITKLLKAFAPAKVLKEKVHMIEREGLSDAEIEEGYILTCQAQIRSKDVELRFE